MKNKEIEELLNDLKSVYELNKPLTDKYKEDCMRFVINTKEAELLLSYIEQLKVDYKEANESVIWWTNRYNAIVKQNDDNHKKVVKLENNRDKAIEYVEHHKFNKFGDIDCNEAEDIIDILKGDSDESR